MVVENEHTTRNWIKKQLIQQGYRIAGIATTCAAAKTTFLRTKPNLSLIGLPLCGQESFTDLARLIRKHDRPFILMASSFDHGCLSLIKQTLPTAFLPKPLQANLLAAQIEIARLEYRRQSAPPDLGAETNQEAVPVSEILYIKADHVYVQIHTRAGDRIVQRRSLTETLSQLPEGNFIQTHRSFAVNMHQLSHWDDRHVYVGDHPVPVSRSRRQAVLATLKKVAISA